MTAKMTVRSVMEGRVKAYSMLSRLYLQEVDKEYLGQLKKMRCPINTGNVDVDEGYRLFHSYLSGIWERTMEDLRRDYLATFIGANTTGHAAAYPLESVHTSSSRLVMQDARDEARAIYRAAGFDMNEDYNLGEDHIAIELEYMAALSERVLGAYDEGDDVKAASLLMSSYHFLLDHLANWVPILSDSMLKFAQTDFYRALAHLTKGFIEEDRLFLEEVMAEEIAEELGQDDASEAEEGEAALEVAAPEDKASEDSE